MGTDFTFLDELFERADTAMGKKLTTKQRKRMKDSTFCGPGRSFPVNDCAHYTAALRLLNRSKFSDSTKSKIRSCIMSKGRKLGCGGAKKAKSNLEQLNLKVEDVMSLPVFEKTVELVEASLKNPGMDLFDEKDI